MARLNTAQMIQHATDFSHCGFQVIQDPAVRKSWSIAGTDSGKALTSIAAAFFETTTAWRTARMALR